MKPLSIQSINDSDVYMKAPYEAWIQAADGSVLMKRTGITPPGYPSRAIYQVGPYEPGKACYVYEAGHFWPAQEWREQARADGRYDFKLQEKKPRKVKR